MIAFRLNGRPRRMTAIQPFRSFPISAMTATSWRPRTAAPVRRPAEPCLVELNGKACLACSTPMSKVTDGDVVTLEGLPETLRRTLGMASSNGEPCSAVSVLRFPHAGQGTPANQSKPHPGRSRQGRPPASVPLYRLRQACGRHPRCRNIITGREHSRTRRQPAPRIGLAQVWRLRRAVGTRPFVNDIDAPGMAHGAIVFSEAPRAAGACHPYG